MGIFAVIFVALAALAVLGGIIFAVYIVLVRKENSEQMRTAKLAPPVLPPVIEEDSAESDPISASPSPAAQAPAPQNFEEGEPAPAYFTSVLPTPEELARWNNDTGAV